jgi:hypothetical protein
MRKLFAILSLVVLIGCGGGGGGGSDDYKENNIYKHRMYLNSPPWTDLVKVPAGCEFALRFEFEKFNADTYGLWFQAESDVVFIQTPKTFYELSPASVGKTLFWFLYEDTYVDVWLEMEDGSLSVVYSFLIEVVDQEELGITCDQVYDFDLDEWKEEQKQCPIDPEEEVEV